MLYKDNWKRTQQKFKEFWARENHDRPLIAIECIKKDGYYYTYNTLDSIGVRHNIYIQFNLY